jgi:methionyl-tRNA formyltransferase
MDEKMDHGAILAKIKKQITNNKKFTELHNELAEVGAELLVESIPKYLSSEIKPQEQEHNKATFCKRIKKKDGEIDWLQSAEKIYNQWRAFYRWPGVYASSKLKVKSLKLKFIELKMTDMEPQKPAGEFFVPSTRDKKLYVACGNDTVLEVLKLQPEGKKVLDAQSFINGYLKKE